MNFLNTLLKKSMKSIGYIAILGVFNSLLNGGLLIFINSAVSGKKIPFLSAYDWQIYVVLTLSALICARTFQRYMIKITNNILFDFELEVLNKLRYANYQDFQELGNEKIYTAINDTRTLAHAPEVFMNAFNAMIVIICCFGYLFWISPMGAAFILLVMAALLVFYIVRNNSIEKDLNRQRDLQNVYYRYLDDLLNGFKELKMSLRRSRNIFEDFIISNRKKGRDIAISTSSRYMDNELTGSYSWYIVLGVIMFLLPRLFNADTGISTAFLVSILYLIGPIAILITLIPTYTAVKIAIGRLNVFDHLVESIEQDTPKNTLESSREPFNSIRMEGVSYRYYNERDEPFLLEKIDLTIRKGEVVFVTGGNGSGKSTFGYLLAGLYKPYDGTIYMNEKPVSDQDYPHYSNMISAVFTSGHLFNENYDQFDLTTSNKKLQDLIRTMDLTGIIKPKADQATIFGRNFSKGQQKRLALVYALLEDKEVIVLDEWAAEQDPSFRGFFYKELLPRLKREGKTIIAITHDDEYYNCATRVIKFNFGKIVADVTKENSLLNA
ncbi:cyclic peptide export ABC transporter [Chitinophaga pendula]|uniref:cyclic peptide export ABC transporter n=1 Tax=Chitinophaga TaxID=79328 RepID=UPI000BAFFAAE|nr:MULTISPECIES: cyclic peptide export ABC transporter [Chitinophaga]ASZ13289.1 cyclic peptide transporter [Chitinophaga sp. MD30]UCJ09089.1 cyclic peptide export ABC transporter [Chitinophaga pendula]